MNNPLEYQPSGTCNFSQIDDTYLQLTLNKKNKYQNQVNIDMLHFDVLIIQPPKNAEVRYVFKN